MKLAWLLVLTACAKQATQTPPVRSHDELLREVTAFATLVHSGTLPAVDDARFVRPPSEPELAWIVDHGQPMGSRIDQGLALFDQIRTVIHAYGDRDVAAGKDSLESTAWMISMVVGYADLVDVLIGEFLPTVAHDAKYQNRIDGLHQVEQGAVMMLQGGLTTVAGRRIDVGARRHILEVWHAHATSFRKVWTAEDCTRLAAMVAMTELTEKDAEISNELQQLSGDLQNCHGAIP